MKSQWGEPLSHSFMPVLDRALGRILRRWCEVVNQNDIRAKPFDIEQGSLATKKFLEQVYTEVTRDRKGKSVGPKGLKLYARRSQLTEDSWQINKGESKKYLDDVGKYLRNSFQYLIQSPTIVPNLEPAREVVILGVGASLHAGLPKTEELFEEVKKFLRKEYRTTVTNLQKGEFNWAWCGDDIENLLSALQTKAWTSWAYQSFLPQEEEWVSQILSAYRNVILRRQCKWRRTYKEDQTTAAFLRHLTTCFHTHTAHSGAPPRWAVISFNQDTVTELEACSQGWEWQNGYGFIPAGSGKDLYSEIGNFRIYKPHGTVAWYRDQKSKPELGACQIMEDVLSPTKLLKIKPTQFEGKAPLILAPSFFKNYEDKIIWDTIAKMCYELHEARHVRVVGFRLRPDDTLVSHLIRLSLRNNIQAKAGCCLLELIGPDVTSRKKGTMGFAWADVQRDLLYKGWKVKKYPKTFCSYVSDDLR